jgi:hypothetical protein
MLVTSDFVLKTKVQLIRYMVITMCLLSVILNDVIAQNKSSYHIPKYRIEYHNRKLTNNDGSQLLMTEMVTIVDRYVFHEDSMFFYIDSVQDSFIRLIYSTDRKPVEFPLSNYLVGNNKVQFYGFDLQKQLFYDLNNDSFIKYELEREDTSIIWKNKTNGTLYNGQCKIEVSKDKSLHLPPISFFIKNVHPIKIESPKITVQFEKKYHINWLPFKKEMDIIREKLNQVSENTSIKKAQFKDYFIPTLDELMNKDKKSK